MAELIISNLAQFPARKEDQVLITNCDQIQTMCQSLNIGKLRDVLGGQTETIHFSPEGLAGYAKFFCRFGAVVVIAFENRSNHIAFSRVEKNNF
jgi:hypothetical protein